jgi:hypothetical protein
MNLGLLVLAVIIAAFVGLILIFVGRVLKTLSIPIAVTAGGFLEQFGWAIGVLVGLWYFFSGGKLPF